MPCFKPLQAWRTRDLNPETGKRIISFSKHGTYYDLDEPLDLPCGQCIGCRLERSRQWAIRCVHEAQCYERNCFITLTYSPEHLPPGGTLVLDHFQRFMKRLRKRFGSGIRFFHCGEYGEKGGRPHYHACLFNFDFDDKELYRERDGVRLYTSAILSDLWGFGFVTVGDVSFESAAYVARYITKKITGDSAESHYGDRKPEYTTMSRRPGIGAPWFQQFGSDVFPSDEVVLRGRVMRPPRFYDSLYEHSCPEGYAKLKRKRKPDRNYWYSLDYRQKMDRLPTMEEFQLLKFKLLIRGYENGKT